MNLHFQGKVGVSDAVAALALVVSAAAFLRPWLRERRAALEVRLEGYWTWRFDKPARDRRVVLLNRGPGAAHDVEIRVDDADGSPAKVVLGGHGVTEQVSVPLVHSQQTVHWMYVESIGGPSPTTAQVTWRDGRLRRQRATIWLSRHEVL